MKEVKKKSVTEVLEIKANQSNKKKESTDLEIVQSIFSEDKCYQQHGTSDGRNVSIEIPLKENGE